MTAEARNRRSQVTGGVIARLPGFREPPVISHVTALQYWGCAPYGSKLDANLVHVAVRKRNERSHAQGVKAHLWTSPMPIHRDKGFCVVQPAVCLAQMASYLSDDELVQVASTFACRDRSRRVASLADLIAYAEDTPRFHGRDRILRMRPYLLENTDSPREALLAKFLIESGIGPLVANHPVKLDAGYCIVDLAIVALKLGFEYQGAYHADTEQMRRDANKHNQLIRRGWKIIYVTAKDFEHPYTVQQFLLTVRGAIAHQTHLMGLREAY